MRYSRPVRLIFGIIILIAFGWVAAQWMTHSVMSNDVGKAPAQPAPAAAAPAVQAAPAAETTIEATPVEAAPVEAAPVPSPTSAPTRPEELKAAALGLPSPPAINIHDWQYVLVNGDHPIEPL